jgi:hypothetical protein
MISLSSESVAIVVSPVNCASVAISFGSVLSSSANIRGLVSIFCVRYLISSMVLSLVHSSARSWIFVFVTGVEILVAPLVNVRSFPLDILIVSVVVAVFSLDIVAALDPTAVESMIAIVTFVPFLVIATLVPRTPAMSPPPPILTPVDVSTRPHRRPSFTIACATVLPSRSQTSSCTRVLVSIRIIDASASKSIVPVPVVPERTTYPA